MLKTFPIPDDSCLNRWLYSGGEVGVRCKNLPMSFAHRINNSDDLMALIMALHVDRYGDVELLIPYLPYARQDRVVVKGDPDAVDVLASMLHLCNVSKVYAIDVHSEQCIRTFKNNGIELISISPIQYLIQYMNTINIDRVVLVSPDKGAAAKTASYAKYLNYYIRTGWVQGIIYCKKLRDPQTGKLERFEVDSVHMYQPLEMPNLKNSFLIVDDICDGGGTFYGVKEVIGAHFLLATAKFHLWTTHGIYSKGTESLLKAFATIGSTDSFIRTYPITDAKAHRILLGTNTEITVNTFKEES
jgi:ribose-phosphate pyrophosphokinase